MDGGQEVDGAPVVSGGDVSEVLELVEEALDAVPEPIGLGVVGDDDLAAAGGGDDRLGVCSGDELAQGVAVVSPIGDHAARVEVREKLGGGGDVVGLAAGEDEAQRPALRVGNRVDLGGQSSSGTPQSLILGPPFPVAACWWALTKVVSSIRY